MNMPAEPSPVEKPGDTSVAEVTPQATTAHPSAGHETTDVRVTAILKALAVVAVMVVICMFGLTRLTASLERGAKKADPVLSPMAESQTPPLPRLEALPRDALEKYRAAEEARLKEYRWVDREKKVVELPIDRAMQLLVERGIPEPAGPAATGPTATGPTATGPAATGTNPSTVPPAAKEAPR